MSGKRIVEETVCQHGIAGVCKYMYCYGGSRRVLIEGQYVLIEKVDGGWPEWATSELAAFTAWGADPDLSQILDALSDHTEGET